MKHLLVLVVVSLVLLGCGTDKPASGQNGETGSASSDSGISGHTTLGPGCPLESAASPCPTQPVAADIEVRDSGGSVVAHATSASDGTFRIGLSPGVYVVTAKVDQGVPMPQEKTTSVTVPEGSYVTVDLVFDSGIRAGGAAPLT
jgi:hypothetical protein